MLVLSELTNGNDRTAEIGQVDDVLWKMNKVGKYSGKEGLEVKYIKGIEQTCAIVAKSSKDPKRMTVLEFYSALELLKQQNRPNGKSNKNVRHNN